MSHWTRKTIRHDVVSIQTRTSTILRGKRHEEYAHVYSLLTCGHEVKRNLNQKQRKRMRCEECERSEVKP